MHLSWTLTCMSDCRCLDGEVASQLRQLLTTQPHILALPKWSVPTRSHNSLSYGTLCTSYAFEIVEKARPKQCSKSIIALLLSNTYLRRFYLLLYILLQIASITTSFYTSIQDFRNRLASCMFPIWYIFTIFLSLLFPCYYWISWSI